MDSKKYPIVLCVILLSALPLMAHAEAGEANDNDVSVVVYRQVSMGRLMSVDALVKVGVGLLAFILLVVSVLAYKRERRSKFMVLVLAFMLFTLKGLLSLVDLLYPGSSPILLPFADSFDFLILLLFVLAVMKD